MAAAFQHLMAVGGPRATSFAAIAREAGVSVGMIQHYFPDRASVLQFSYEHSAATMVQRVEKRVAEGEGRRETIATMVLAGLQQLLPLDDVRRGEAAVYRGLLAEAPYDDALGQVARSVSEALRLRLATAVANGKTCGEVAGDVDAAAAAVRLLAVTTGLGLDMATRSEAMGPDDTTDVLRPVVDIVFTGRCRRHD